MTGMCYSTVVHLQGDEGYDAQDILDERGDRALLDHLMSWEHGEDGDVRDTPPWGAATTRDYVVGGLDYVVAYDRTGSVSLTRVWWDDEPTIGQIIDWRYAVANGDTTLGLEDWAYREATK